MLSFAGSLRVFLALEPCDLRKSFNGRHALAAERLGEDPRGGGLLVFCNRRRTRREDALLRWDWVMGAHQAAGGRHPFGFAQGRLLAWPKAAEAGAVKLKLTTGALALLTDGVDLRGAKLRPWYERE